MTMVNNVIGVVNYVIAARPSLLNFMIADSSARTDAATTCGLRAHPGLVIARM